MGRTLSPNLPVSAPLQRPGPSQRAEGGPTKALIGFIASLDLESIDAMTLERARAHTLDTIGACLAGSRQPVTAIAERAVGETGSSGGVPVPGLARRRDMLSAAFLAGTACHGLELDDGFRAGAVHPGAVVVPAALVSAYDSGASGGDFLRAVIAGYEVSARIAAVIHPAARRRGFHNTPLAGVFAAAAAAGVLRGLDPGRLEHAFGLAASSASGLHTYMHGGDVKRIHCGLAARDGVFAALLAENGFTAAENALEIDQGFFRAFAGDDDGGGDFAGVDILGAGGGGGSGYAVAECYLKPHACCRHLHPAIDGLLDIVGGEDLQPTEVAEVRVGTYRIAARHADVGWQEMAGAQLSYPFALAVALRHRAVRLEHFSPHHLADPAMAAECAKVTVAVDADCEADYPRLRPATVTVLARDGRRFERRVDEPYGAPANPMTDGDLRAKFRDLATPVLGTEATAEVEEMVGRLDGLDSVAPLIEALSPAGG